MIIRLLLTCMILTAVAFPAAAFEFPFNLIQFGTHFDRMQGETIILRYPTGITDEVVLRQVLVNTDQTLKEFAGKLGIRTQPGRVIISLYNSREQKRKLTGNYEFSHLEDGQVHRVLEGPDTKIGDAIVALTSRRLGPCARTFLQMGLRFLHEPCFPDWSAQTLEIGFYHAGLLRHPADMFREEEIGMFSDVRCRVTAASFVGFLLENYPADCFRIFYRNCGRKKYPEAFEKAYGFSFEEARIQWLERLSGAHLSRDEAHHLDTALIAAGVRIHP